MNTTYDVLGVPRNASDETIKAAFHRAAKSCHPDLNAGDRTAEQQLRQAIAAYQILKDPQKRAAYDQFLRKCRRETGRRFAATIAASLASGSAVAVVVWLSAPLLGTHVASGPPETPHLAAAMVRQPATDDGARQDGDGGRVIDWDAAAPKLPEQTASLHPPAGSPEPQVPLAREWDRVQASGDPRTIWAFAVRNPDAPESELARSKLIALIDTAEDVSLLNVLRLVATDAIAERAQERLIRLGAVAAAKTDSLVSDAPSSDSLVRASVGETTKAVNREEPVAQRTPGGPRIVAKRQATIHSPVRQVSSENRNTPGCSGSQSCSTSAPPLFGVGF